MRLGLPMPGARPVVGGCAWDPRGRAQLNGFGLGGCDLLDRGGQVHLGRPRPGGGNLHGYTFKGGKPWRGQGGLCEVQAPLPC